jgi:hypothetical protein
MRRFLIFSILITFIISGCSNKKVFEPQSSDFDATSSSCATPVSVTASGATLDNGKFVSDNSQGEVPEGFTFASDIDAPVFVDDKGNVNVEGKTIHLKDRVITASLIKGQIAFVTYNNRYGLYDLKNDTVTFQNIDASVNTIHAKTVAPVAVDDLIIFPTLNGKLIVVSNNQILREIIVTPRGDFNNIIFLEVFGNTLIAATANDVIALGGRTLERQKLQVADIVLTDEEIYIFTKDGRVLITDERLQTLQEKTFQFANFIHANYHEGYVYAVEKAGYIIAFAKNLNYRIYELNDAVEDISFFKGATLYYGGSCQSP